MTYDHCVLTKAFWFFGLEFCGIFGLGCWVWGVLFCFTVTLIDVQKLLMLTSESNLQRCNSVCGLLVSSE